jgi:hypothetical protein
VRVKWNGVGFRGADSGRVFGERKLWEEVNWIRSFDSRKDEKIHSES